MKLNEVSETNNYNWILLENRQCNFRVVKQGDELLGYYDVDGKEFVAKIEEGVMVIDGQQIPFINFAFGSWDGSKISFELQNDSTVNPHKVIGCADQFLWDNLSNYAHVDIIVFAATYNNFKKVGKYKTLQEEVDARMRVYNMLAEMIAKGGSWGIMAKNIPTGKGQVTLIMTKDVSNISNQTLVQYLTKLGKI
jgi:hypothetical protein